MYIWKEVSIGPEVKFPLAIPTFTTLENSVRETMSLDFPDVFCSEKWQLPLRSRSVNSVWISEKVCWSKCHFCRVFRLIVLITIRWCPNTPVNPTRQASPQLSEPSCSGKICLQHLRELIKARNVLPTVHSELRVWSRPALWLTEDAIFTVFCHGTGLQRIFCMATNVTCEESYMIM